MCGSDGDPQLFQQPESSADLVDSHCHIHQDSPSEIARLKHRSYLMATTIQDISKVNQVHHANPHTTMPWFGVHPWFAHEVADDWLDVLRSELESNHGAGVGEIGLDKLRGKESFAQQVEVFTAQYRLAAELQRPVSVHCVRAHGELLGILKSERRTPPIVALHSYTGNAQTTQSLLRLPCGPCLRFGFSHIINSKAPKSQASLALLPLSVVLLESDVESAGSTPGLLNDGVNWIAGVKGVASEEVREITTRNAHVLLLPCTR